MKFEPCSQETPAPKRPSNDSTTKERKEHKGNEVRQSRRPFAFYAFSYGQPNSLSEIANLASAIQRSVAPANKKENAGIRRQFGLPPGNVFFEAAAEGKVLYKAT